MTAIDKLCQLLDERNVEYDIRDNSGGTPSYVMVGWFFIDKWQTKAEYFKQLAELAEAENVKLRELVRAAWRCIHTGASCSDCRLIAGGCTLQTAMRELGIEVDG